MTLSPSTSDGTAGIINLAKINSNYAITIIAIIQYLVAGSDFTQLRAFLSVPLVFSSSPGSPTAGPRKKCFTVSITNDNMDESTESFSLLLQEDIFTPQTGATINPNQASVFILDDD